MVARWNWLLGGFALVVLAVLAYAWIDGGREPVRPITQPIPIPETTPVPGDEK